MPGREYTAYWIPAFAGMSYMVAMRCYTTPDINVACASDTIGDLAFSAST
jgi:hypothetical protein